MSGRLQRAGDSGTSQAGLSQPPQVGLLHLQGTVQLQEAHHRQLGPGNNPAEGNVWDAGGGGAEHHQL